MKKLISGLLSLSLALGFVGLTGCDKKAETKTTTTQTNPDGTKTTTTDTHETKTNK